MATPITTISVPLYRQVIFDKLLDFDDSHIGLSGMLAVAADFYNNVGNAPILKIDTVLAQQNIAVANTDEFINWQKTLKALNDITQAEAKRRL